MSQNLWKCLCKTVNFSVTSKKLCCIWKSVQFSTCWCHAMLTLVFSMDALGAFPIACRRQWRTPYTQVRTMHNQMENMFPPKAEMQYWGHCGKCDVLPKIVKVPNIHQRLTRQKLRMDNLSSRRSALANFGRSALFRKSFSSRREVIHAHLLAREALMNVRKFDNLRKDIAYPAMSPILMHLRFWGNMLSIWCSTCIVRTRVLGVRH